MAVAEIRRIEDSSRKFRAAPRLPYVMTSEFFKQEARAAGHQGEVCRVPYQGPLFSETPIRNPWLPGSSLGAGKSQRGVGLCWAMNWLANFAVSLSFPVLAEAGLLLDLDPRV